MPTKPFYYALPPLYLRRVLAWLSIDDLVLSVGTCRMFRYASLSPLVLYLHSREVTVRCSAAQSCLRVATDQNTMQDLVACDFILSLMLMLQDGRSTDGTSDAVHGQMLRRCASDALRRCYEFRPARGVPATDPKHPMLQGSREDLSDTAEAELLYECLRLSGLTPERHPGSGETDNQAILEGTPCFAIVRHTPVWYAPAMNHVLLSGVSGRPAVTVIERADNERRLMYLGSWYLEGFCESEAPANKLGHELLFWYAKCVVASLSTALLSSAPAPQCAPESPPPPPPSPPPSTSSIINCDTTKEQTMTMKKNKNKKKILILGLGAGVLPAFLQRNFPHVSVDVCEINQGVVDASIHGFGMEEKTVTIYVDNCLNLVQRMCQENAEYDAVVCDVYGDGGMPRDLCDIQFLKNMRSLVIQRSGIVLLNCGHEMDDFDALVKNFQWIFRTNTFRHFGHPDEENRILVGETRTDGPPPNDPQWQKNVENVISTDLFSLFLIHKLSVTDEMYYMTFVDHNGICAADSLSVNATKLQYATKKNQEEGEEEEEVVVEVVVEEEEESGSIDSTGVDGGGGGEKEVAVDEGKKR